jgi:16S rRNA (guanine527-N7)-methyltransferase
MFHVERSARVFHVKRLDELAARYGLDDSAVERLGALLEHQERDEHASTTVRAVTEAVDRHVADSLVALDLPELRSAGRMADLGSGAGWPGLALAVALPDCHVALVESASRRCRYLERAVAAVRLDNVSVVHARAEEWRDGLGRQDVVTARALAALPVVLEYAAPLLRPDGLAVAWKGRLPDEEAAAAASAAAELALSAPDVVAVDPYPGAGEATLVLARKIAPTPERFPRRPGMALKRPLGAGGNRPGSS